MKQIPVSIRSVAAASLVSLALPGPARAQQPPLFHVRDMGPEIEALFPTVQYPGSRARGLNENGDLVGEANLDGSAIRAFVHTYEHGVVPLPLHPGWPSNVALDVSDRDANGEIVIVGGGVPSIYIDLAIGEAVLWRFSTVTGTVLETRALGIPPGYSDSIATGVDDAGTIVGYCMPTGAPGVWKYDVATSVLQTFSFPEVPAALNDNGQIVGGPYRGDLFGNYQHMGNAPGTGPTFLYDVNDAGGVMGRAGTGIPDGTGYTYIAIVRRTGAGTWDMLAPISHLSLPGGLNDGDDFLSTSRIYVQELGQEFNLGSLLSPEFHRFHPELAAAINDNQQVAATSGHAILLTPLGRMILPGDVNGDVEVDLADHCAWLQAPIDLDGDGDADAADEQWLIDRLASLGYTVEDCNGNGLDDYCDIAEGSSSDCDEDGVPDECQPDCSGDGIPDVCEPDCNANGVPDPCDIQQGTSEDCNYNGVPDECDAGGVTEGLRVFDPPLQLLNGMEVSDDVLVLGAGSVADVDFSIDLDYRIGYLTVLLSHGGTTITLIDRPGYPQDSSLGNSQLGYDIVLDDEGTGGPIEDQGNFGPPFEPITSPPSYTPNEPLSTFDGMPSEGVWTVTVITDPSQSPTETFRAWGVHVTLASLPVPPCTTVGTRYCFCDGSGSAPPCDNAGSPRSGCGNSANPLGAYLTAQGTASVTADDLELVTTGASPSQPGLYFSATNATNGGMGVAFGDGLRCAGGGVVRLATVPADASGSSTSGTGIAARTGVGAGDVRRFQLWYRDPAATCTGLDFNLTNGLAVTWTP